MTSFMEYAEDRSIAVRTQEEYNQKLEGLLNEAYNSETGYFLIKGGSTIVTYDGGGPDDVKFEWLTSRITGTHKISDDILLPQSCFNYETTGRYICEAFSPGQDQMSFRHPTSGNFIVGKSNVMIGWDEGDKTHFIEADGLSVSFEEAA